MLLVLFYGSWQSKTDCFLHTIPKIKLTLVELSNDAGEHCVKIKTWSDPESPVALAKQHFMSFHGHFLMIYVSCYVVCGLVWIETTCSNKELLWFTNVSRSYEPKRGAKSSSVYTVYMCISRFYNIWIFWSLAETDMLFYILLVETFSTIYDTRLWCSYSSHFQVE